MRTLLGGLLLVAVIVLPSCGSGVNQVWLAGVEQGVEAIVPEYLEYVDKDPSRSDDERTREIAPRVRQMDDERKIRHHTVELLRTAIQKAKQE